MKERRNNQDIIEAVQEAVKVTVNGKIDYLTTKLDAHIKDDKEWKEKIEPILTVVPELVVTGSGVKAVKWFNGFIKSIAAFLTAAGLVGGAVWAFLTYGK